jgi:hypothetical protein
VCDRSSPARLDKLARFSLFGLAFPRWYCLTIMSWRGCQPIGRRSSTAQHCQMKFAGFGGDRVLDDPLALQQRNRLAPLLFVRAKISRDGQGVLFMTDHGQQALQGFEARVVWQSFHSPLARSFTSRRSKNVLGCTASDTSATSARKSLHWVRSSDTRPA